MRNASCVSIHLHSTNVVIFTGLKSIFHLDEIIKSQGFKSQASLHKCHSQSFSNIFPLRVLSHQPIWGSLAHSSCVCVCWWILHLHSAAFLWKSAHACVCVYVLGAFHPPIHHELAEQIDTALGFLAICKSTVTVMRAVQRRRRCGKCQHVSEEWHRTSELWHTGAFSLDPAHTLQGQTHTDKNNPSSCAE